MPDTSPRGLTRLALGGDYNPEQWPESVWQEDVRLMREAGVTMVSVGIFSWALLEPAPGQYDFGWRAAICHSNADYRAAAAAITTELAERYGGHPALALWHVHNEYGMPVSACYCDSCAAHFRRWLADTYDSVDAVNEAWGTSFWG